MVDSISQKRELYEAAATATHVPWRLIAAVDIGTFNFKPSNELVSLLCNYYSLPFMLPEDSDIVRFTIYGHVLNVSSGNRLNENMFYREKELIKDSIWKASNSMFSHYNSDPYIINPYNHTSLINKGNQLVEFNKPGIYTIYESLLSYGNDNVSRLYINGVRSLIDSITIDGLSVNVKTRRSIPKSIYPNEGPITLYVNSKPHPIKYASFLADSLMVEI